MSLTARHRLALVILVLVTNLFAMIISPTLQRLNRAAFTHEAYLFRGNQYVDFEFYNSTSHSTSSLRLHGNQLNDTHTLVQLSFDGVDIDSFFVHPNGWIYQNNTLQENVYSVWWIFIPNVLVFAGVREGDQFSAVDPTGFFTPPSEQLLYDVEKKFVFLPVLPQHANLSGSQASFVASLYRNATHQKIGSFIFDTTSGALEQAEAVINGHWCRLLLADTSYGISRNRYVLLIVNIGLGLGVFGVIWGIAKAQKRKKDARRQWFDSGTAQREEFLSIFFAGLVFTSLDIVDTWFYLKVGFLGSIALDAAYIILLLGICRKWNYGYKWVAPAFFEFVYARPFRGYYMIPFMGIALAWLAMVWASGVVSAEKMQKIGGMPDPNSLAPTNDKEGVTSLLDLLL